MKKKKTRMSKLENSCKLSCIDYTLCLVQARSKANVHIYLFQTTGSIVTTSYQKESRKIYIHKTDTVLISHLLHRPYRDND